MSNSSQMRELGGLVDNLYLSSKNRHHQDVTAAAPTQSRKNTKVGPYSCPAQACPHEGTGGKLISSVALGRTGRPGVCIQAVFATARDGKKRGNRPISRFVVLFLFALRP